MGGEARDRRRRRQGTVIGSREHQLGRVTHTSRRSNRARWMSAMLLTAARKWTLPEVQVGSKAEKLNASKCFPLYPQDRTSLNAVGMSVSCQKRSFRLSRLRQRTRDHSGNPAFRSPSMCSFALDCPPRAIHADIVKAGSSSSRRAAASRASASRPRWAKAAARQR
jgi:hypothetical protein